MSNRPAKSKKSKRSSSGETSKTKVPTSTEPNSEIRKNNDDLTPPNKDEESPIPSPQKNVNSSAYHPEDNGLHPFMETTKTFLSLLIEHPKESLEFWWRDGADWFNKEHHGFVPLMNSILQFSIERGRDWTDFIQENNNERSEGIPGRSKDLDGILWQIDGDLKELTRWIKDNRHLFSRMLMAFISEERADAKTFKHAKLPVGVKGRKNIERTKFKALKESAMSEGEVRNGRRRVKGKRRV